MEIIAIVAIALAVLYLAGRGTICFLVNYNKIKLTWINMIREDLGEINFSEIKVENSEYRLIESTRLKKSQFAWIKPDYYENITQTTLTSIDKASNLLVRDNSKKIKLYCNFFRLGYLEYEKMTDKIGCKSIEDYNKCLEKYMRTMQISSLLGNTTLDCKHIKLLGRKEGAMYLNLIYRSKTNDLRQFLLVDEELKNELLNKVQSYFRAKRTGKAVAIFIKAMWLNKYLLEGDSKETIYKAIETFVGYKLTPTPDRSSINKHLNPNSVLLLEDAGILAEKLKV